MKATGCRVIVSGIVSLIVLTFSGPSFADCTGPVGVAGDQFYNTSVNKMQYCNGTDWMNMAAGDGGSSESDPQVGTLTSGKWCTTNGTVIDCASNAPVTSESDPQVGTLTNTKWCTTDGTDIDCTTDAPVTSESDPEVGTLTDTKWCKGSGYGQVVCDQDAPSAASNGLALLDSGTVANQATLDIALPSGYRSYKILVQNIVPATDDVYLWLRTSSNGGSSYDSGGSDYKWVERFTGVDPGGSGFDDMNSDTADSEIDFGGMFGNGTNENVSLEISIINPTGSGAKLIRAATAKYQSDQSLVYNRFVGARMSSSAIDAVRLLMSSGNISTATWVLYGYN